MSPNAQSKGSAGAGGWWFGVLGEHQPCAVDRTWLGFGLWQSGHRNGSKASFLLLNPLNPAAVPSMSGEEQGTDFIAPHCLCG